MDVDSLTFEQALNRLAEIVRTMEDGGLGLQESLNLFDEGTRLGRRCSQLLDEAELRVSVATEGVNGVELKDFRASDPAF